jgi:hypothetical protein
MSVTEAEAAAQRFSTFGARVATGSERYRVVGQLGAGSGGQVNLATDLAIGREVAIKTLHEQQRHDPTQVEGFLAEVRLTARLEHPGVLPVYDLAVEEGGSPYFTMRRFRGRSLGSLLGTGPVRGSQAINERITLGIKVGEALAYAHGLGVVHRDVKPDNILVGDFGEVVLIDWGAARASGDMQAGMAGTPLYMAPEQARGESADPRSDVYALAATLFHSLLGRPPTASSDADRFWMAKRSGRIDMPFAAEVAHLPAALLAILLKGLAADPAARYASAVALVADLHAFQAGLAVSAVRDGRWTRFRRFCRRHRTVLLIGGPAALLVAGSAWLWQGERALARSQWRMVVDEHFDSPAALASGWRASRIPGYATVVPIDLAHSGWSVVDGALIGDDTRGININLARIDLPGGPIRASWSLTPGHSGNNLNCFVGASNRVDGYLVHVGGWGRADFVAVTRGSGDMLDSRSLSEPLRQDRTYRFELEFDQGALSFAIDGERLLSCRDPDPIPGSEQGGFGFEASGNLVRIDDLQVQVRPQARLVSPLASADTLVSVQAHARAASAYLGFARTWPEDPLAPLAKLRGARAQLRAGLAAEALPILEEFSGSGDATIAGMACYELLRAQAATADDVRLDDLMRRLGRSRPETTLARLGLTAARDAVLARTTHPDAARVSALVLRMRQWAEQLGLPAAEGQAFQHCAELLNRLGHHEAVLRLVPEATIPNIHALLSLARFDEVHRRYPGILWARYYAWRDAGRLEDGLREINDAYWRSRMLRESGRHDDVMTVQSDYDRAMTLALRTSPQEALEHYPQQVDAIARALILKGRPVEVLALSSVPGVRRAEALLQLDKPDEAVSQLLTGSPLLVEAEACKAARQLATGDMEAVKLFARALPDFPWSSTDHDWFGQHFAYFVLPSLIDWVTEGIDPVPRWRELAAEQHNRCGLRTNYRWNGLLGLANSQEILGQPYRAGGHPRSEVAWINAQRADLAGDANAPTLWRDYLAVAPPHQYALRAWAVFRIRRGPHKSGSVP